MNGVQFRARGCDSSCTPDPWGAWSTCYGSSECTDVNGVAVCPGSSGENPVELPAGGDAHVPVQPLRSLDELRPLQLTRRPLAADRVGWYFSTPWTKS